MTDTIYKRPSKTKASAIGQKGRTKWSRLLRKKAFDLFPPVEVMAAEESVSQIVRSRKGYYRAAWTTIRVRFDQVAIIDILRQRHLENTGKEISRGETMAALITSGLEAIQAREEFKRSIKTT